MSNKAKLTDLKIWSDLEVHKNKIDTDRIDTLFDKYPGRNAAFQLQEGPVTFDFSKTKTTPETLSLLSTLAEKCDLKAWQDKMISGMPINNTDDRPALHMALRGSTPESLQIGGQSVTKTVQDNLARMHEFCHDVRAKKQLTNVVNIGVGGSDLGPALVCEALKPYADPDMQVHFLSTVDPAQAQSIFANLHPEKTLFIVSSKSFGTQETLANFGLAKRWLARSDVQDWRPHFVTITARADRALEAGFDKSRIFDMPAWVGGRFSLWSAIGLSIPLTLGFEAFERLLAGAKRADDHFMAKDFERNIPVMMALLGIWHRNFFHYESHCILPYNYNLRNLPRYVQQLDMESNGKRVDRDGCKITDYETAPIVFGDLGTNAQHAFFQMLHQGTTISPCEFIVSKTPTHKGSDDHTNTDLLLSNVFGQAKALMTGERNDTDLHLHFKGDRPSTMLWLDDISPETIGMLLGFYEHKTFTQGVIWNLNSFDQWGVELGKALAREALNTL